MSYPIPKATNYTSKEVPIPDDFLTSPPPTPLAAVPVPFTSANLPEYKDHIAFTISNVLSPTECTQLRNLVESSVPDIPEGESPWKPALLRLTPGVEVKSRPGYRESGRIVWCNQTITDRIWERCVAAKGVGDRLAVVKQQYGKVREGEWVFRRVNDRMSFLRYEKGQYFKPHCDGPYFYETEETEFQTHYTLQLYLNDSKDPSDEKEGLVGGATAFLSRDKTRRLDVNPEMGSVLIFQHEGLLHEGAEVKEGVKYAMRTDILYEWVKDRPEGEIPK